MWFCICSQEAIRIYEGKASTTEPFVFQTEIAGDTDHKCSVLLFSFLSLFCFFAFFVSFFDLI